MFQRVFTSKFTACPTPITAMGSGNLYFLLSPFHYKTDTMGRIGSTKLVLPKWLSYGTLNNLKLKGKHCRKPHCRNGVVDYMGPLLFILKICQTFASISMIRQFHDFLKSNFWRGFSVWPKCARATATQ